MVDRRGAAVGELTLRLPAPVTILAATWPCARARETGPSFTVDDPRPVFAPRCSAVSLAAEEGRDRENIDKLAHGGALVVFPSWISVTTGRPRLSRISAKDRQGGWRARRPRPLSSRCGWPG